MGFEKRKKGRRGKDNRSEKREQIELFSVLRRIKHRV